MSWWIVLYIIFLITSLIIIIWVGHNLHRWGSAFLVDVFVDWQFAEAVNNLLLAGYYLIIIGYMLFILKSDASVVKFGEMIEMLSAKVGFLVVVLAVLHYGNMVLFTFWKLWNNRMSPPSSY